MFIVFVFVIAIIAIAIAIAIVVVVVVVVVVVLVVAALLLMMSVVQLEALYKAGLGAVMIPLFFFCSSSPFLLLESAAC